MRPIFTQSNSKHNQVKPPPKKINTNPENTNNKKNTNAFNVRNRMATVKLNLSSWIKKADGEDLGSFESQFIY